MLQLFNPLVMAKPLILNIQGPQLEEHLNWRTFLSIDINALEKGETKAARHRQESPELLLPNSAMYPEVKTQSSLMGPVVWQGMEYPSGLLPPENVVREVLWELYEFVTHLANIMKSWKGEKPAVLDNDLSNLSQNAAMELENIVAKYYCQQFFNYFRHAAQIPHCLFVTNSD
ncbi:hypothetical protein BYT27DRAFT_7212676 [Phlegmacium glaucopus]|nr:hypothetical protein BYT27DRAFT_7212676 [Phlegmacium glaucopus]